MIIVFVVISMSIVCLALLRARSEVLIRKYMDTSDEDDSQVIAIRKNMRIKWHRYDALERVLYVFIFAILVSDSVSEVFAWWLFLLVLYGIVFDLSWNKQEQRHPLYLGNDATTDTFIKRLAKKVRLDYKVLNFILRVTAILSAGYILIRIFNGDVFTDLSDWDWLFKW